MNLRNYLFYRQFLYRNIREMPEMVPTSFLGHCFFALMYPDITTISEIPC